MYSKPDNMKGFKHVILGNHYPVDKKYNQWKIQELAKHYGCIYIDSLYDRGLHQSLNYALAILDIQPTDIFIGCDSDDRPSHGAFQALRTVMIHDPSIAVLGLNFWVLPMKQEKEGRPWPESTIAGHRVWTHPGAEMFNVVSFNMKLIQEIGGFYQPNAYYGGIEIALYREWSKRQMKLCYLIDHSAEAVQVNREDPLLYDKSYGQWKIDHATKGFSGSFEEWVTTPTT